ncbi:MAG: hypothetical protein CSB48_11385 [Proteobacteria bacterium]|nr:MAG: hypothetical protein CSB48_11385 [Pseudomonadota bacterium]
MFKKTVFLLIISSLLTVAHAGLPDANKLQALKKGLQSQLDAFKLLKNSTGKCVALDMASIKISGSPALVQDCTGKPNQKWSVRKGIISNPAKLCIQPVKNEKGETSLQAVTCTGGPDQVWQVVGKPGKPVEIRKNKQCLAVVTNEKNAFLVLQGCVAENTGQKWIRE